MTDRTSSTAMHRQSVGGVYRAFEKNNLDYSSDTHELGVELYYQVYTPLFISVLLNMNAQLLKYC